MPVATKSRPPRRATSYRPRHSAGRHRAARRSMTLTPSLQRSQLVWLGIGGLGVLAVSLLFLAPILVAGFEAALNLLGLGLPLILIAIAANVWLARRAPTLNRRFWRIWGGSHLLLLFALGLAGIFEPDWQVGDVSFSGGRAGGGAGRLFVGSAPGVLVWLLAGFTGLGLVWPRGARAAGDAALAGVRFAGSLQIPQNAALALKSFFTSLLPKEEEEDREKLLDRPYLAQWDEEWEEASDQETSEIEEGGEEEEISSLEVEQPSDEPEAYHREL